MAKTAMKIKQQRTAEVLHQSIYNAAESADVRMQYLRKYGICRVCFRELAYKGQIPGVKKASW